MPGVQEDVQDMKTGIGDFDVWFVCMVIVPMVDGFLAFALDRIVLFWGLLALISLCYFGFCLG